jgi:hypothetical protein
MPNTAPSSFFFKLGVKKKKKMTTKAPKRKLDQLNKHRDEETAQNEKYDYYANLKADDDGFAQFRSKFKSQEATFDFLHQKVTRLHSSPAPPVLCK